MTTTTEHLDLDVDVMVLAHLLGNTDPELFAPTLPAETDQEWAARRQAAADIIDTLIESSIIDDPDGITAGVDHVADLVRMHIDRLAEKTHTQVRSWWQEIRGVAA